MAFARQPPWLARILNSRNRTAGTGIAVDREYVITCGHLKPFSDSDRTVVVEFPFADHDSVAKVVFHTSDLARDGSADLAVLKLRDLLPEDPNTPMHRAIRFSGRRVRLRGFPDETEAVSPTADVELSEFSRPGWVQINPTGARGWSVHDGFSGGPVWDESVGAVIGMVVAKHGNGTGHLLTLEYLCELWPGLAERFRMPPTADGADSAHWWPRSRGLQRDSESVWRFRGRRKAIDEIATALDGGRAGAGSQAPGGDVSRSATDTNAPTAEPGPPTPDTAEPLGVVPQQRRKPLIVTGTPGVGKSATLARVVTTSYRPWRDRLPAEDDQPKATPGSVDCAVHAQGKTALEVAQAIALRAGIHDLARLAEFPAAMREALDGRERFGVVIDAVDEAVGAAQAEAVLADVITPLAEFPAVRVIAGSRRYLGSRRLLATGYSDFELLDLDDPEYFELADLADYALATLRLEGEERQGNPYTDHRVAEPVAREIARRSDGNFLVAGLIARAHGRYDTAAVSPDELTFTGKVDDAFRSYLSRLPRFDGVEAEQLLTALAFAEAPGFTVELWATALKALDGVTIDPLRLEAFTRSSAASFLIEQSRGEGAVYRLFHQALVDVAKHDRTRGEKAQLKQCEARLTRAFLAETSRTGWGEAPEYLSQPLVIHATRADLIDDLLEDPEFLVHAEPGSLLSHVTRSEGPTARLHAAVFRAASWRLDSADTGQRRALLAYNASRFKAQNLTDHLARVDVSGSELGWRPRWACGSGIDDRLHTTIAKASTLSHLECVDLGGRTVAVTCEAEYDSDYLSGEHTRRFVHAIWDLGSGKRLQERATAREVLERDMQSLGCGQVVWFDVDDVTVVVTHNYDERGHDSMDMSLSTIPVGLVDWRESFDAGICSRIDAFITVGSEVLGLVIRSPAEGELWNLCTGRRIGESIDFGGGFYHIVPKTFTIINGNPVVAVLREFEAELWDLVTHRRVDRQSSRDPYAPLPVACGKLGGRVVAVDLVWDATAVVWDLMTGEQVGRPLRGVPVRENRGRADRAEGIRKVAFVDTDEGQIVSFHTDDSVASWDVATGERIGERLDAAYRQFVASASARLNGRPITVAASQDFKLQVWDVKSDNPPARTPDLHSAVIADVTTIDGDEAVLSACKSPDNKMRLWGLATGEVRGELKTSPGHPMAAVTGLWTAGRASVVTVSPLGVLQERSLPGFQILNEQTLAPDHIRAARATAVLVHRDRLFVLSDCAGPHQVWVFDRPDGTARGGFTQRSVYELSSERETFYRGAGAVVKGRVIAAMMMFEGNVRLYDLETREELHRQAAPGYEALYEIPGTVTALAFATVAGRELLFVGRDTGDVHVSDFATGARLATLPFNEPITALDTFPDGRLVVASGRELSVFQYRPSGT